MQNWKYHPFIKDVDNIWDMTEKENKQWQKSGAFSRQKVPDKLHFSIETVDKISVMNDITNADMAVTKFVSDNGAGH